LKPEKALNLMDLPLPLPLPPDHQEHKWMLRALCRKRAPKVFFPSDGVGVERLQQRVYDPLDRIAVVIIPETAALAPDRGSVAVP